jgi:hypothetical protein
MGGGRERRATPGLGHAIADDELAHAREILDAVVTATAG